GSERFGLLRVLEALAAYLAIVGQCLNLACGTALLPRLTRADHAGVNSLLAAAARGLLLVGAGTALFGLAVAATGLLPLLAPAPEDLTGEVRTAFLVLLAAGLFAPLGLGRVLFEADQRGYRSNL